VEEIVSLALLSTSATTVRLITYWDAQPKVSGIFLSPSAMSQVEKCDRSSLRAGSFLGNTREWQRAKRCGTKESGKVIRFAASGPRPLRRALVP